MRLGQIRRVNRRSSSSSFWRTSEGAAALILLFSHQSSSSMKWDFRSSKIDGPEVSFDDRKYAIESERRSTEWCFHSRETNVKRYLHFRGDCARFNRFFWFRLESAGHSNGHQRPQTVDIKQCDPHQHGCEYFYFNNWIRFFRIAIYISNVSVEFIFSFCYIKINTRLFNVSIILKHTYIRINIFLYQTYIGIK